MMDVIRIYFTKCGDVFRRFNFSDDTEEVVFNPLPHDTILVDTGVTTELVSSCNPDRGSAWYLGANTGTPNDEDRVRLAIKFATHIEVQPRTEQYEVAQSLKEEALFYLRYLKKLQGRVVPVHFGLWIGRTSWAGVVVCVILEWGGHPWSSRVEINTHENRYATVFLFTARHLR